MMGASGGRVGCAARRRLSSVCALLLFLPIVSLGGCAGAGEAGEVPAEPSSGSDSGTAADASMTAVPEPEIPTARAVHLADEPHPHRVSQDTHLVVERDVALMPRRTGIVEEIFVDRGANVTRSQLLLRLQNLDLELQLRKAEIDRQRKEREFKRSESLYEQELISESEYDQKRLDFEAARVEVDIAREELEKSLVRAPFDGQITDRFVRVGQKVIADDNLPLFRITGNSDLEARLYLSESVARRLAIGHPAEILSRVQPGPAAAGRVKYLSPVVDSGSGDVLAIIALPNRKNPGPFRPGAAVTITLEVPAAEGEVGVPREAFAAGFVPATGELAMIEVVEEGRRTLRRVVLGEAYGPWIGIREGLQSGDRVVLKSVGGAAGKSLPGKADGTE